jgi:hypothetical protein
VGAIKNAIGQRTIIADNEPLTEKSDPKLGNAADYLDASPLVLAAVVRLVRLTQQSGAAPAWGS